MGALEMANADFLIPAWKSNPQPLPRALEGYYARQKLSALASPLVLRQLSRAHAAFHTVTRRPGQGLSSFLSVYTQCKGQRWDPWIQLWGD